MQEHKTFCAFSGPRRVAAGSLEATIEGAKRHLDQGGQDVLVFEDQTGRQLEFDWRGSLAEVLGRAIRERSGDLEPQRTGPGRPKLGVVSREVSLLPRHWEWLEQQPGGASAALRKLVEVARKSSAERARSAREAASKFMWAMTGDLPGFEEATRALFAKEQQRLEQLIAEWPEDLRSHVQKLTREASRLEQEAQAAP
jgi:hypothetical protein